MKKLILSLMLIVGITLSTSAQNARGVVSSDVNVRWKPSTSSGIIKVFPKGTEVVLLKTKGSWSFIQDPRNNKKGWVSSKFIQTNIKVVSKKANVRSSPGGKILKKISKGQKVIVLQEKGNWNFIKDISNNKKGWVHKSLLSATSSTSNAVSVSNPSINSGVSKVSKSVPNCDYVITSPTNGDKNVNIKPTLINWVAATGSPEGYYLSLGSNTSGNNILNNINIGNVNTYSALDLKSNTTYTLSLVPFNSIGLAACEGLFTFTTGSGKTTPVNNDSENQVIEARLRDMGILWKWRNFNKNKISKFKVTDINTFFNTVKSFMGVQYRYGGTNRSGIDCSGLVYSGLKSVGYTGERLNAESVAKLGTLIANKESLVKGDLVCFSINKKSKNLINHIAVYNGNGGFIHAPSSGKTVQTSNINEPFYWNEKFIFGVRLTDN